MFLILWVTIPFIIFIHILQLFTPSKSSQAAVPKAVERALAADRAEEVPGAASQKPRQCELTSAPSGEPARVPKTKGPLSSGVEQDAKSSEPYRPLSTGTPERAPSISMARGVAPLRADSDNALERVTAQGAR